MRLIPVIDILNGVVVRGIAGQRDQYRPLQSAITDSVDPLRVATAIRERFGLRELYVADLDAITRESRDFELYRQLSDRIPHTWIDAGVTHAQVACEVLETGFERVIIGSESCTSPACFAEIVQAVPPARLTFSLDLKSGESLASPQWGKTPLDVASSAIKSGAKSIIILDLATVGTGAGVSTLDLCAQLRQQHGSELEIITGGGLRNQDDLCRLEDAQVDAVLVASALHASDSWLNA